MTTIDKTDMGHYATKATVLFTKLCSDGGALVSLTLPPGERRGDRVYAAIMSREEADELIELFDPDGSIRACSMKTSEVCLYK